MRSVGSNPTLSALYTQPGVGQFPKAYKVFGIFVPDFRNSFQCGLGYCHTFIWQYAL
jgi:hypothetical protein